MAGYHSWARQTATKRVERRGGTVLLYHLLPAWRCGRADSGCALRFALCYPAATWARRGDPKILSIYSFGRHAVFVLISGMLPNSLVLSASCSSSLSYASCLPIQPQAPRQLSRLCAANERNICFKRTLRLLLLWRRGLSPRCAFARGRACACADALAKVDLPAGALAAAANGANALAQLHRHALFAAGANQKTAGCLFCCNGTLR